MSVFRCGCASRFGVAGGASGAAIKLTFALLIAGFGFGFCNFSLFVLPSKQSCYFVSVFLCSRVTVFVDLVILAIGSMSNILGCVLV